MKSAKFPSLCSVFLVLSVSVTLLACHQPAAENKGNAKNIGQQQAVAMPDRFAASVATDVLNSGGNAVDAAIAAQFSLAVTYPEAGNIGGGGFMVIRFEDANDFIDYRETAPEFAHRDMYLDEDTFSVQYKGRCVELTSVEFQLFKPLFNKPNRIFNRESLMETMYADQRIVSFRTIDSHIKKLRKKLDEVCEQDSVIQSVYGVGYRFVKP